MGNATLPDETASIRRWVETWKLAGPELERIRKKELRALTEEEAFEIAEMLSDSVADDVWIKPQRRDSLGLVEQQRLLQKLRTRPL